MATTKKVETVNDNGVEVVKVEVEVPVKEEPTKDAKNVVKVAPEQPTKAIPSGIGPRNWFAGLAMAELINDRAITERAKGSHDPVNDKIKMVVDLAYKYADAMLKK